MHRFCLACIKMDSHGYSILAYTSLYYSRAGIKSEDMSICIVLESMSRKWNWKFLISIIYWWSICRRVISVRQSQWLIGFEPVCALSAYLFHNYVSFSIRVPANHLDISCFTKPNIFMEIFDYSYNFAIYS